MRDKKAGFTLGKGVAADEHGGTFEMLDLRETTREAFDKKHPNFGY